MQSSQISNSSLDFQEIIQKAHKPKVPTQDLYLSIMQFRSYKQIPTHVEHVALFKKFIQNKQFKVLFVFGPSGSGKHLFIRNQLQKNQIPYAEKREQMQIDSRVIEDYEMDEELPLDRVVSLKELIFQSLGQSFVSEVEVYDDFPITSFDSDNKMYGQSFKKDFYQALKNSECKLIFILNTDIYNPFYIETTEYAPSVLTLKFKQYTNTQNKTILKHFSEYNTQFEYLLSSKEHLDEILEIANGDARKMLTNAYLNFIKQKKYLPQIQTKKSKSKLSKLQKAQLGLKLKNDKKISLFHLLGKFLYAKRLDVSNMKDRAFTKSEIQALDPPFYFDPVVIFEKSSLPLTIFSDLLFENYLQRFGSLKDCISILQNFVHLDSQFPTYIKRKSYYSPDRSQQIYIFLLTWGTILSNKDSSLNKKSFSSFQKARNNFIVREANQKKNIIKKYFSSGKVSLWISFGYMLKNSYHGRDSLITKLLNKSSIFKSNLTQEVMTVSEEQEEQQEKDFICVNQNEITRLLEYKIKQKNERDKRMKEIMNDMDDSQSDISSEG